MSKNCKISLNTLRYIIINTKSYAIPFLVTSSEKWLLDVPEIMRLLVSVPPWAEENPDELSTLITALGGSKKTIKNPVEVSTDCHQDQGIHVVQKLTGLPIWRTLSRLYLVTSYEKIDGDPSSPRIPVTRLSHDSFVYLLEPGDTVIKLYLTLGASEIREYHRLQSQIAEKEYSFNLAWKFEWREFSHVHVNVLPLSTSEDSIRWTECASVSCIPYSPYRSLYKKIDAHDELIVWITDSIKKSNQDLKIPDYIHPINIQVIGVEENTLRLQITDIADTIADFLRSNNFKWSTKRPSNLIDAIRLRWYTLFLGV
jgi:hypothetical protein